MFASEAQYAYSKNKKIVALRLQRDYMPDGWLGPLCLNDLHYDFSVPQKFEEEWSKLHAKLMELNTSGIVVCSLLMQRCFCPRILFGVAVIVRHHRVGLIRVCLSSLRQRRL